jgi:hypothetical protein
LYWEKDESNPNQVIYDLENDEMIIPNSEEDIVVTPLPTEFKSSGERKVFTRGVNNGNRRNVKIWRN